MECHDQKSSHSVSVVIGLVTMTWVMVAVLAVGADSIYQWIAQRI